MEKNSAVNKLEIEFTVMETMMMAEALRILNGPDFYELHFSERMTTFEKEFNSGLQKMNKAFTEFGFLPTP